ncbi:c-type cytochrome [Zavarzinella formosa]|uniref:c-type cytochrome n=1 Tax=Zavarzinella formosa TaxID=360055 RepID=UPI00031E6A49|nr:c-type cytochrome [Zavarzinella formosa]
MIRLSRRILATGGIVLGSLFGHSLTAADPVTATQAPKLMATVGSGLPSDGPATAKPAETPAFRGTKPFWIWGADDKQNYTLKAEFTVPAGAKAIIRATCDNQAVVKINDTTVIARCMAWEEPVVNDFSMHLKPGANVLEAAVINEGGVAGFLCQIEITDAKGVKSYVISDDKWEAVPATKAGKPVAARKIGLYGVAPWNKVFEERNAAAESSAFFVKPGFQVEKLFTVPKDKFGSWVNITFDNKGRLIASDQGNLGLYRITPPKPGSKEETKVEKLDVKMSAAQGLLYAFDSLYVVANGGPGSGLYRLRDTKGTDQFDEVVKLKAFAGGGEHGPHAVRLTPDGKNLLVIAGNHTLPPEKFDASRLPSNWNEDFLMPRHWDPSGHARGILAPGGWVAKTDPDGKTWEIQTAGYRNPFDFALNADGEMFVYDADMEYDVGSPWYRPTRVNHATSGSELGWRSGTGKWPAYYPDSLPAAVDIGPGSPVGVEFGYGTKFPAKYQKALFILDWTFGTIYSIHLEPQGSSYKGVKEEFVSRTPLPLTDVAVGPDGNLYFTIGGRGTQSELFRVSYVGSESTEKVEYKNPKNADQREIRHQLEFMHSGKIEDPAKAVAFALPYLKSEDRFLRYAARVALEHLPTDTWADKVLTATDPDTVIQGTIGLAHQGSKTLGPKLTAVLQSLDFAKLDERQQIDWLRALALVFIRTGEPDKDTAAAIVKKLDPFFPNGTDFVNRELCLVLVYLKSPTVIAKTTKLLDGPSHPTPNPGLSDLLARNKGYGAAIQKMIDNGADQQKLAYIYHLRNAKDGWTMAQRKSYFAAIADARTKSGGASYQAFLNNFEKDNFDNAPEADRLAIEAAGLRKPFKPKELPKPQGPGKTYTMEDMLALEGQLKGRNYANGLKMFSAAQCVQCHRFYGDGGSTGPDMTQSAGRFSYKDMAESIIMPSKIISDQYRAFNITTNSGKKFSGKIVTDTKDLVTILTDPLDSTKVVDIKRADIDEIKPSAVSMMPENLLSTLNQNEVLDLMAYLLSRGDPNSPLFKK